MDEYDRKLGLNEDVIRVLTLKIDQVEDEPSIIMQSKNDRASRDDYFDENPLNASTIDQENDSPKEISNDEARDETQDTQNDAPEKDDSGKDDSDKENSDKEED